MLTTEEHLLRYLLEIDSSKGCIMLQLLQISGFSQS